MRADINDETMRYGVSGTVPTRVLGFTVCYTASAFMFTTGECTVYTHTAVEGGGRQVALSPFRRGGGVATPHPHFWVGHERGGGAKGVG